MQIDGQMQLLTAGKLSQQQRGSSSVVDLLQGSHIVVVDLRALMGHLLVVGSLLSTCPLG